MRQRTDCRLLERFCCEELDLDLVHIVACVRRHSRRRRCLLLALIFSETVCPLFSACCWHCSCQFFSYILGQFFSLAVWVAHRVVLNLDLALRRSGSRPLSSGFLFCDGCDIVQADHAPEAGVAQGIFHGDLIRHQGGHQEELEEELEEEVERRVRRDHSGKQTQVRMHG